MARRPSALKSSNSIEYTTGLPADARTLVELKSDLTATGSFPYPYEGLPVYCKEDKTLYILKGDDPTEEASWQKVGEAGDPTVPTKTGLYALQNTHRGMIVYVIDEDKYYRLVNDLPAFEASWKEWASDDLVEMTDAEIDALFA